MDALSTFTATELISYNDFVALTVISNTFALQRVDLKKIIEAPEVIQVLPDLPILGGLVQNLHHCRYAQLFVAFTTLKQTQTHLSLQDCWPRMRSIM